MARSLSPGQKKLLTKFPNTFIWDDLPEYVRHGIVHLNDYETVIQDAERFLGDQYLRTH